MLRFVSHATTDRGGTWLLDRLSGRFKRELLGVVTDQFYEVLLRTMDTAFSVCKDFRKNIKGFEGRYLFRTADDSVTAGATFKDGNMKVHPGGITDWDVRVTFRDAEALSSFLFSRDQDILDSLLRNDVEVHGNANYIYRFGFLSRDLTRRLGIE